MIYENILENLQLIVAGEQPKKDISGILINHKCDYLLDKLGINSALNKLLNKISVNERYRTCNDIFKQLEANGISYAVIKGAALSLSVYGNPYIRNSGDIDILINRKDIDAIGQIMRENGFIQGHVINNSIVPFTRREIIFQTSSSHQTAPYIKSTENKLCPNIMVDINTDIMWGESEIKSDMELVFQETCHTVINGITFKKLCTEMEFISLCLHHYKDTNSIYLLYERGLKLGHYCDIYFFVKNCNINLETLYTYSRKLNVCEYIYYCLYYTNLIFQDAEIKPYIDLFYSEKSVALIDKFGLSDKERQTWNIDFFTRLFDINMRNYLETVLSKELLNKIKINQMLM